MKSLFRITMQAAFLWCIGAICAFAQFGSGIEGTVHDQTDAVIPQAKVTITDTRLGVTRTAVTSEVGYFRIDSIAASTYSIRIEANGFTTWAQTALQLQTGEIGTLSQKGRNAGATVDVYTKSGTNQFHGSLGYYLLNNALTASTEFQSTVPTDLPVNLEA